MTLWPLVLACTEEREKDIQQRNPCQSKKQQALQEAFQISPSCQELSQLRPALPLDKALRMFPFQGRPAS